DSQESATHKPCAADKTRPVPDHRLKHARDAFEGRREQQRAREFPMRRRSLRRQKANSLVSGRLPTGILGLAICLLDSGVPHPSRLQIAILHVLDETIAAQTKLERAAHLLPVAGPARPPACRLLRLPVLRCL